MQIGILQCGTPPGGLDKAHGTYEAMFHRLLEGCGTFRLFDAAAGALPDGPDACEAYVVTGSAAGVYDGDAWIAELMAFLRRARGRAKLVGICFGHQAMAQAFGGSVVKSPKGWGIGLQSYEVTQRADWMDEAARIAAPASHQDQVVVLPGDARIVLRSDFTPYAGLDYGDAISFQFHPEFATPYAKALIESRRALYGDLADPALASYDGPDDRARVARWIRRFLASG